VMFPDAKDVQPHLIGQFNLFQQVAQPLLGADAVACDGIRDPLYKGVDTKLHWAAHSFVLAND
jgi:hypothetical protein